MNSALITGCSEHHIHWFSEHVGLHKEVVSPWQKLCSAAKKQGFELTIASGFRSFERQLVIWNKKLSGELAIKNINNEIVDTSTLSDSEIISQILTFSALPGASRHHWGTEIDYYDTNALSEEEKLQLEPWEYQKGGPFADLTQWLKENAVNYGFYFPYDKYRGGIASEPWHLSYYPLARNYQQQLTEQVLSACLSNSLILHKSYVLAQLKSILTQYVFNIGKPPHG